MQPADPQVARAISFLSGDPQPQAMLLLHDKPAQQWRFSDWIEAMQGALFQMDPIYESRFWMQNAGMRKDGDFSRHAAEFRPCLANMLGGRKMAMADQVQCVWRTLKGSGFYEQTEDDHSTHSIFIFASYHGQRRKKNMIACKDENGMCGMIILSLLVEARPFEYRDLYHGKSGGLADACPGGKGSMLSKHNSTGLHQSQSIERIARVSKERIINPKSYTLPLLGLISYRS